MEKQIAELQAPGSRQGRQAEAAPLPDAAFSRKALLAARREMAREISLARAQGYPARHAGLSERFMDAQDARRRAMVLLGIAGHQDSG